SCVWNPTGKLVDELLTSIQPIAGVLTVIFNVPLSSMSPCFAVAVIVTGVALPPTAVTFPVASTVATSSLSEAQPVMVASPTVWLFASCGVAEYCTALPMTSVAGPATTTWSSGPTGSRLGHTCTGLVLLRGAGAAVAKSADNASLYAQ